MCNFQLLLSCDMCVSVTSRCVRVRGFKLVASCVCVCIFQLLSCDMCVSVTSRCVRVRGFKLVASCVCVTFNCCCVTCV